MLILCYTKKVVLILPISATRSKWLVKLKDNGRTMLIDKDEDFIITAASFKAISHPLRLKILCALGNRELSVQDIVEQVGSTQSNISQHLAVLRSKNLLATQKDANRVYYRISDSRTLNLVSMVRDVFCSM